VTSIVNEEVERYADAHTTPPGALLLRLADETRSTLRSPTMLTGTVEGRLLEFLVFATGARRVLELGTYSGYSAISMAAALPPDGHIDTCEVDEAHAAVARRYIEEAGYADRITIHLGPALDMLAELEGSFDLVFVDADKVNYVAYYEALLPRLVGSGLMVFDNTLWSGRVVEPDDSEDTKTIMELNDRLATDPAVVAVQLTVRDGVTLVRHAAGG
jgi:caffeoyl-CoA O-methyltransferase